MNEIKYFANSFEGSFSTRYFSDCDFEKIDKINRSFLFNFEIEYIKKQLRTRNFYILYYYWTDKNHRVVCVLNLDTIKTDFSISFKTICMPYIKLFYQDKPFELHELVYVFKKKDNSIYEKSCSCYRPKVDSNYKQISVGYVNKYGHELIEIYERVSIRESDYSSIIGAGLILDK